MYNNTNKDYLEIELEYKEIVGLIKKYYYNTYPIKSCKVNIKVENIKDKLKEIDLFHHDKPYYNLLFKTIVTGKLQSEEGMLNTFREELNEQGTKEIIHNVLADKYNFENIKIGYNFYEKDNGKLGVKIAHMIGKVDKKVLAKRMK